MEAAYQLDATEISSQTNRVTDEAILGVGQYRTPRIALSVCSLVSGKISAARI